MPLLLQSIPCLFGEKISVFIRETLNTSGRIKDFPPLFFNFPILIKVGFNVETKIVIMVDGSTSFDLNSIGCQLARFSLENPENMSQYYYTSSSELKCHLFDNGGDGGDGGGGGGGGGGGTGGNSVNDGGGETGVNDDQYFAGIDLVYGKRFLREIAERLVPYESRVIFLFQDESSLYNDFAYIRDDLRYLLDKYKNSAPSYVHIFAIGATMIPQLKYAWILPPIEGSGWTWSNYYYGNDFFSLMAKRFTSVKTNKESLVFSIPLMLKNLANLKALLGKKPFVVKIWKLDGEYLANLNSDETNKFGFKNQIIPLPFYSELVYEYNSQYPLTVTHLCEDTCCPPGCCMIRVKDQFCCVK